MNAEPDSIGDGHVHCLIVDQDGVDSALVLVVGGGVGVGDIGRGHGEIGGGVVVGGVGGVGGGVLVRAANRSFERR